MEPGRAPTDGETTTPDLPTSALERGRLAFEAALRSGDAAAAAAIYADDATLLAPDADILHGRSAIERFWRTGVETGIDAITLVAREVRQRGDVAFEVGEYTLHVTPETGAPLVDRGRYLVVLRFEADGSWRRAAEMFSPDRSPLAVPEPA